MIMNTEIYEKELSFAEIAIVISAFSWLQNHPDADWKQSETAKYIEQSIK